MCVCAGVYTYAPNPPVIKCVIYTDCILILEGWFYIVAFVILITTVSDQLFRPFCITRGTSDIDIYVCV